MKDTVKHDELKLLDTRTISQNHSINETNFQGSFIKSTYLDQGPQVDNIKFTAREPKRMKG